MKRLKRIKIFTAWLLIAAFTLPPFTGVAEANDAEESTLGEAIESAITTGTSGDVVPKVFAQNMAAMSEGSDVGIMPLATEGDASGINAIAFGAGSKATRQNSIAIGVEADTAADNGIAIGIKSKSKGDTSTAVGGWSEANGKRSSAFGSNAVASADYSTAVGYQANALGESSIAVGNNAEVYPDAADGIAIGTSARVINGNYSGTGSYGIAIGTSSWARGDGSIAIGADAYAESMLLGLGINDYFPSTAVGTGARATGRYGASAFGGMATATAEYTSAFGYKAQATGEYDTVFGSEAKATGRSSSAFGHSAEAIGVQSSAFGERAKASEKYSSAFGSYAKATGSSSSAFGFFSYAISNNSVALGSYSYAARLTSSDVYIPSGSVAKTIEDTVIGTQGVVSIGDPNGQNGSTGNPGKFTRQLTGLAAGIEDTDAVNVAQLKALEDVSVNYVDAVKKDSIVLGSGGGTSSISNLTAENLAEYGKFAATTGQVYNVGKGTADALGGDFKLDENGNIAGTFKFNGTEDITTVQGALTAVDDIAVKYNAKEGNSITLKGSGGTTISGLKDADISSTSTQAVSGKQLFAVSTDVAEKYDALGSSITENTNKITAISDDFGKRIAENAKNIGDLGDIAVKYDEGKNSVTLVGADGNSNVTLKNVAAGADDTDAVNMGQLRAVSADLGMRIDNLESGATPDTSVVKYDDAAKKDVITLNKDAYDINNEDNAVALKNVKSGIDDLDAVNVKQLKVVSNDVASNKTGIENNSGKIKALEETSVKYKENSNNKLTLDDDSNGTVKIWNVAAVELSADSKYAVTGAQLYATNLNVDAVSMDVANKYSELDGRIDTNESGISTNAQAISNLTTSVTAVSDDLGSRISTNATNIGILQKSDELSLKYDDTNKKSVTLGGTDGNSNVTLKHVAAGAEGNDAVNVSQLNDALGILGNGAVVDDTNGTITKNDFAYRSDTGLNTVQDVFNAVSGDVAANETKIKDIGGVLGEGYVNPTFTSVTIGKYKVKQNTAGDGLDMGGARLTNIKNGTELNDAVNFGQLSAVSADLGARIDNLNPGEGGTTDDSVVKYDNAEKNLITLNKGGGTVKLTRLTSGDITSNSTDAVTGGQLYETNQSVEANTEKLSDIGIALGDGYVNPEFTSVTIGKYKVKQNTAGDGLDMDGAKLTNLTDGTELTDAATVGQLNEAKQSIETLSNDITTTYRGLDNRIDGNATAIGLLQDSMGIVSGDLAGITGEISDFKEHVTKSEGKIGDLEKSDKLSVKYNDDMSEIKLGDTTTRAAGDPVPVLISNLRGGDISKGSNQAITGGQLYEFGDDIRAAFGGATQFANGVLSVDLTVGSQKYNSVQDALTGLATGAGSVTSGDFGWTLKVDGEGQTVSAGTVLSISSSNNIDIAKNGNNAYVFNLKDDITVNSVTLNKAAEIKEGGMEASTVGQLHSLGESAANILGNFLFTDGELTGSFTVNGTEYKTVQEALDAAAESGSGSGTGTGSWTLSVNGKETNIGDGGKFALASGSNVEINKNDAGAYEFGVVKNPEFESIKVGNINIREEGINMGGNTITGLANGGIYQGSNDAVTGDQLWNAYRRIDTIDERVQVVGAHAAALSALHPVPYNPYEPTTFSAGFGMYRNEQSVAVGVFHYVRENVLVNAGFSLNSDGDTMGRAGISFAIGKSGRKQPSMVKDVASMQQQMAAMQQMLVELKEENEKNKEENIKNRETIERNEKTIKELKEALEKKK